MSLLMLIMYHMAGWEIMDEHTSIVPDSLVDEFIAAIESWMKSDGEMSEMPIISCGKL